jgi:hypothetical protein
MIIIPVEFRNSTTIARHLRIQELSWNIPFKLLSTLLLHKKWLNLSIELLITVSIRHGRSILGWKVFFILKNNG